MQSYCVSFGYIIRSTADMNWRRSQILVVIGVACFTLVIITWKTTTHYANLLGKSGKLVSHRTTYWVARFRPCRPTIRFFVLLGLHCCCCFCQLSIWLKSRHINWQIYPIVAVHTELYSP